MACGYLFCALRLWLKTVADVVEIISALVRNISAVVPTVSRLVSAGFGAVFVGFDIKKSLGIGERRCLNFVRILLIRRSFSIQRGILRPIPKLRDPGLRRGYRRYNGGC